MDPSPSMIRRRLPGAAARIFVVLLILSLAIPTRLMGGGADPVDLPEPRLVPAAQATHSPWEQARQLQRHVRGGLADSRYVASTGEWVTAADVAEFLERRGSPMAPYAALIVATGNLYDVDPRLVISISGIESGFGKYSRGHNAWGWNAGRTHWSSWEESIVVYISRLAHLYPDREDLRSLATRYNPAYAEGWSRHVGFVWRDFDEEAALPVGS